MDYLSPQSHIDEDKFNEILIRPLEKFLVGATKSEKSDRSSDPAQILKQVTFRWTSFFKIAIFL